MQPHLTTSFFLPIKLKWLVHTSNWKLFIWWQSTMMPTRQCYATENFIRERIVHQEYYAVLLHCRQGYASYFFPMLCLVRILCENKWPLSSATDIWVHHLPAIKMLCPNLLHLLRRFHNLHCLSLSQWLVWFYCSGQLFGNRSDLGLDNGNLRSKRDAQCKSIVVYTILLIQ